jgi:hypothetical protein
MKSKKVKLKTDLKGVKFTTPIFRMSFPQLIKPKAFQEGAKPAYSVVMLFDKDQDLSEMKKAILKAGQEGFGPDRKSWPEVSLPWRDGDSQEYEGYADKIYATAKSYNRILLVDRDKQKILDESEIYGGCYGRAVCVAKATESGGKFFITLYLQGVQKIKDGEAFGAGASVHDFEDLEDDNTLEDDVDDSDDDDGLGF